MSPCCTGVQPGKNKEDEANIRGVVITEIVGTGGRLLRTLWACRRLELVDCALEGDFKDLWSADEGIDFQEQQGDY